MVVGFMCHSVELVYFKQWQELIDVEQQLERETSEWMVCMKYGGGNAMLPNAPITVVAGCISGELPVRPQHTYGINLTRKHKLAFRGRRQCFITNLLHSYPVL